MTAVIVASALAKRYRAATALAGIDWSVPKGSITALVGPNGAGKTTTVKLMLGLTHPSSGALRVFGNDPAATPLSVRRRIGFVPEDKTGFDGLTVAELARYTASFFPTWRETAFRELLADWRIEPSARMATLSKGTRTRTLIALALAHAPELFVLDEPTDGLDPSAQEDVLRRLVDAAAEDRTVVIVTHRLSEVESVADRIAVLDDGNLLLEGDLEELRDTWKLIRARVDVPLADVKRMAGVYSATRVDEMTLIVSNRVDDVVHSLAPNGEGVSVASMSLRELYLAATARASS